MSAKNERERTQKKKSGRHLCIECLMVVATDSIEPRNFGQISLCLTIVELFTHHLLPIRPISSGNSRATLSQF